MTDRSTNPAKTLGRGAVRALVRAMGGRAMLRAVQATEPELIGAWSHSDYAPHLRDPDFALASALADPHTLVDVLRRHELWRLTGQAAKLAPGDYLEVGVWRGGTGLLIAQAMRHFGATGTLYLADTFAGVVKAGMQDHHYVGGEHADVSLAEVERLFETHARVPVEILVGMFPEDTANRVCGDLRLVHVDVDVYQGARDVVEWCYPRLVPGGIVVFDDYGFSHTHGITKLGEEYEKDVRFVFVHNVNGHAILIKR